jgi:rRNA processing protein Gar1
MNNSINNYKIKISCTSKEELSCNNKKISKKNYNKLNLERLINTTDYIEKAVLLYKNCKTYNNVNITTKSLEFICKCNNEISAIDFETFIKEMQTIGFIASVFNTIHLIKINTDKQEETILKYRFKSITEEEIKPRIRSENKSSYRTQTLYSKNK